MVVVYAIFDNDINEIYVGITNNLARRLTEHKRGQSFYTRKFKKIILFHYEECPDYRLARTREKYLKSGCGKEFLKSLLNKRV